MMEHIYKYILVMLAAAALCSCKVDEDIVFGLDMSEITAGPDGGSFRVNVSSGDNWVAATEAPWITISPANGINTAECQVTVDSTVLDTRRTAEIYIQNQNTFESKKITVSQEGYSYSIISDETEVDIPNYDDFGKRYFDLKVRTNTDFIVNVSENASDWFSIPGDGSTPYLYHFPAERGVRPRTVTVRIGWENNTDASNPEERVATISFTPADASGLPSGIQCQTNEVTVTQEPADLIEAGTRQGDSTALMAIARALHTMESVDGSAPMDTWQDLALWEEGQEGCTEENIGRVKYARFYICSTEDVESIPYEVRYLTAAEELIFYSNANKERLSLSTGPYISELTQLKRLTIAYFGLTSLDPSIVNLQNLEYLNLAGNNFESIPDEVFEFKKTGKLHALLLNTNYRDIVYDLANATNTDNLAGLYDEQRLRDVLLWESLDTLTLAVNYLHGSLPTFMSEDGSSVEAGVPVYDEAYFAEHPEKADSLSVLMGMPRILPNVKMLTLNNNRFTGLIPDWLLYHPGLDWMDPFTLIFHQEGSLPREEDGSVVEAGFDNTPVDYDYDTIDARYGGYYEFYPDKKLAPENNQ